MNDLCLPITPKLLPFQVHNLSRGAGSSEAWGTIPKLCFFTSNTDPPVLLPAVWHAVPSSLPLTLFYLFVSSLMKMI